MSSSRNVFIAISLVVFLTLGIAGLFWMNHRYVNQTPVSPQFRAGWVAAHDWVTSGTDPYATNGDQLAQRRVVGWTIPLFTNDRPDIFKLPMYSMLFFAPLGTLDITTARAVWMTVVEIAILLTAFMAVHLTDWKPSRLMLAGCLAYTVFNAQSIGIIQTTQFTPVAVFAMVGALLLVKHKREADAGLLLALATVEPSLVFPVVILTIIWGFSTRRWRLVGGTLGGIAFLLVASMAFYPRWPLVWVELILSLPAHLRPAVSVISALTHSMPGISRTLTIGATVGVLGYLAIEWVLCLGKHERWYIWTAFLTVVLLSLVFSQETLSGELFFFPVVCLVLRTWQERWGKSGTLLSGLFLVGLFLLGWGLTFGWIPGVDFQAFLTVAAPLAALFGLWWTRWWAVRSPRLFYDRILS